MKGIRLRCEDPRYVWIQNPKVASMPILRTLCEAQQIEDLEGGWTWAGSLEQISAMHGHFRFAFVRHPLARLYSCWKDKVVESPFQGLKWLFDSYPAIQPNQTFEDFVRAVAEIPDEEAEPHFVSQSHLMCLGNRLVPDYVGRFERLPGDWTRIARGLNLGDLPYTPLFSQRKRYDFQHHVQFYTAETAALASRRYAEDIERFGYFDPRETR